MIARIWPFSSKPKMEPAPTAPRRSGASLLSLKPVDDAAVWGEYEIREPNPAIEVHENVYYVPHQDFTAWGIFDSSDQIVEASVDIAHGQPIAQVLTSAHRYADIREDAPDAEYIYGGRFHPHFGHFLVEALPRYWSIRPGAPRPKVLVHTNACSNYFAHFPHARAIFAALGIGPGDFAYFDEPRRIGKIIIPRPSFQQQVWAHRAFGRMCRFAGLQMLGGYPPRVNDRPVYLSKSRLAGGVGRVANEAELEAVLERNGVEIVYPETVAFPEQVRLFAGRSTILGTAGSAFHTSIFAPPAGRQIQLCQENTINSNMRMFDALNGNHVLHYHQPGSEMRDGTAFMREAWLPDPVAAAEDLLRLI